MKKFLNDFPLKIQIIMSLPDAFATFCKALSEVEISNLHSTLMSEINKFNELVLCEGNLGVLWIKSDNLSEHWNNFSWLGKLFSNHMSAGHWALGNQKLWQLLRLVGICQRFWSWGSSAQSWPCWSNMNKIWGLRLHKLNRLDLLTNELVVSFFFVEVGRWGRIWHFLQYPKINRSAIIGTMLLDKTNVSQKTQSNWCCNDILTIRAMMRRQLTTIWSPTRSSHISYLMK